MKSDQIYAGPGRADGPFVFDGQVAEVFDDMIQRSVPGYALSLEMITVAARRYGQPGSTVYDLGCSLGASTLALRQGLVQGVSRIVAVDQAPAMIEAFGMRLQQDPGGIPVELRAEDIRTTRIDDASMTVLNFTLQFVPLAERDALLARIARATRPGGVLVLSEKVCFEDPAVGRRLTDLHHEFKRDRGYSELEIARKRSALEAVLLPETIACHEGRLRASGFAEVFVWFQCFNFVSLLAVRA